MVAKNKRAVVKHHEVIVSLIEGKGEASITVVRPKNGPSHPRHVSLQPFLDGGLDDEAALKSVLEIAVIAVDGTLVGNG